MTINEDTEFTAVNTFLVQVHGFLNQDLSTTDDAVCDSEVRCRLQYRIDTAQFLRDNFGTVLYVL